MAQALPPRPNLDWLRKSAKQKLGELRSNNRNVKLAQAQLELAREYGFSSWRALKAHVDKLLAPAGAAPRFDDAMVAGFLRAVGSGDLPAARAALAANPG